MGNLGHSQGTKRGERLPPPHAPPPVPAATPAPARGRPASKVCGISTDKGHRAVLELRITALDLAIVDSIDAEDSSSVAGQIRTAALQARVWSLRGLCVTDLTARATCDKTADLHRTQIVRLERALGASRLKTLIDSLDKQAEQQAKFGGK